MGSRSWPDSLFVWLLALPGVVAVLAVVPAAGTPIQDATADAQPGPDVSNSTVEIHPPDTTDQSGSSSAESSGAPRSEPAWMTVGTPGGDRLDRSVPRQSRSGVRAIELDQSFQRLPDSPGAVLVEHQYTIPAGVSRLELRLPERTTTVDRDGFVRDGDGRLTWDRSSQTPQVTYRYDVNRTLDRDGPIEGPGDYAFVDVGEWALFSQPSIGHSWGWTGNGTVSMETSQRTTGPGAASDQMVFLGEHQRQTRTANGQTFDLVVPAAASLEESPAAIFDALAVGSDRLRVGDRDDRVFLVAAPTGRVEWGARGIQTGEADIWVRDVERLDTASNVWLHEYVHSRQGYQTTEETQWFTEASATYYGALFALEAGQIGFEQFRAHLDLGTDPRFGGTLSRPDSWQNSVNYVAGSLVSGELDRRIRLVSDSERSLQDVLRYMNEAPEPVPFEQLLSFVERAGDPSVRADADRYLTTEERPRMWTGEEHRTAFGTDPARIEYQLVPPDGEEGFGVTGSFRTGTLDPEQPLRVVRGEQLSVGGRARNAGGVDGEYEARFRVDGAILDRRSGRLAPTEAASFTFEHTFEDTGEYTVAVGDDRARVTVLNPATPQVTGVSADRSRIAPGDAVELSITITNSADRPGELAVPVLRNDEEIDRRTVRLDSGEKTTVTVTDTITDAGRYRYSVANTSAASGTVRVQNDGASGLGTTPAITVLLLVVALALGRHVKGQD